MASRALGLVLVLTLVVGCGVVPAAGPVTTAGPVVSSVAPASAAPTVKPKPVDIVWATSTRARDPGIANMWIGIGFGLYEELGLNARVEGTSGHAENLQLLITNKLNMSVGVQDTVLAAQAKGEIMPVVFPCNYLRGIIYRVIVTPTSPIKTFADLKGKKIGVQSLSAASVPYLKFAANAVKIDPNSMQLIAVGSGQSASAALTKGDVDAFATSDVEQAQFEGLGIPLRMIPQPSQVLSITAGHVFAFNRPWYEANKDVVVRLLQGQIKSIILTLENPEAVVRMSYKMFPESIPKGISMDAAVKAGVDALKVRAPLIQKVVGDAKQYCEFSDDAWKDYVEILGLQGKADAKKFYTNELVKAVNDFDEQKFREWARSVKVSN